MKKPRFPFPFGTVHFIGIGGVGMSGIAEIMPQTKRNLREDHSAFSAAATWHK